MAEKLKILLDTDIGSDIDDAVCLAYLLAQPRCDLLGITTVAGESADRARLASALCRCAGREIPIYPGAEIPMLIPQKLTQCHQKVALARWPHASDFPCGFAVAFLSQTIRKYPGEVVLLTIGPLTNVGALFAADPEIPRLLKGLVMMCGVFTNKLAGVGPLEWNAMGDPHATAIVYGRRVSLHRSIGLDVTCRVRMEAEAVRHRFSHPLLRPVLDMAEVWFRERPILTFHDPLAAVTLFEPNVCRFERGTVEVELKSDRVLGMTHWRQEPSGVHEVALDVNVKLFFDAFFEVFGG